MRKAERGWVVGDENVADLTSAMVLADLFAADQAVNDDTTALKPSTQRRRAPARRPAAFGARAAGERRAHTGYPP